MSKKTWDIDEAIRLRETGLYTNKQISERIGVCEWTISQYMKKNNIKKPIIYTWDTEEATSLYKEGYSLEKIGKMIDCNYNTIGDYMRKNNIVKGVTVEWYKQGSKEKAICMYKKGCSLDDIGDIFGVSRSCVGDYMKNNGIINPKSPRKITIDIIKKEFEERGYRLISTEYINANKKIEYICLKHKEKGVLSIKYGGFQQGQGCWYCRNRTIAEKAIGYYNTDSAERNKEDWIKQKALVYFIKCYNENEEFYKIGITTNTTKKRFSNKREMPYQYEVLKETKTNLYNAIYLEKEMHLANKKYSYIPNINFNGSTECFKKIDKNLLF